MDFTGADILSTRTLSRVDIEKIVETARDFLPYARKEKVGTLLEGCVLAALFYEPSTRTRLSFETAMQRLGGRVITVAGMEGSSLMKGETLSDTAKIVENFADVIALRHPVEGAAREMADAVNVPVLNGGDGANEHPTQALLDVFTLVLERGVGVQLDGSNAGGGHAAGDGSTFAALSGLKIAMVGDLKYGRPVHSLVYLLLHFGVKFWFVSPEALRLPADILADLKAKGAEFTETENLEEALSQVDACYMTRIQKERFTDSAEYEKYKNVYVLTRELVEKVNPKLTILHPLPRVGEISLNVDGLPGAAYFRQVQNGVAVRMALLALVLGKV